MDECSNCVVIIINFLASSPNLCRELGFPIISFVVSI